MLADVHVAAPQPKKSVSSVQIGQPRDKAAARIGQSSGSRAPRRFRASASKSAWRSRLTMVPSPVIARSRFTAFAGSPPRLTTSAGMRKEMVSAWDSRILRTRFPSIARMRMLASNTSALAGFPLLLAAGATDLLVLLHEFVFRRAPGCNHGVEFLRGCPHGVNLGLAAFFWAGI